MRLVAIRTYPFIIVHGIGRLHLCKFWMKLSHADRTMAIYGLLFAAETAKGEQLNSGANPFLSLCEQLPKRDFSAFWMQWYRWSATNRNILRQPLRHPFVISTPRSISLRFASSICRIQFIVIWLLSGNCHRSALTIFAFLLRPSAVALNFFWPPYHAYCIAIRCTNCKFIYIFFALISVLAFYCKTPVDAFFVQFQCGSA